MGYKDRRPKRNASQERSWNSGLVRGRDVFYWIEQPFGAFAAAVRESLGLHSYGKIRKQRVARNKWLKPERKKRKTGKTA